jgi:cytochrome c oxidase subunit 1
MITGLHVNFREMLATTIHEAKPEHRYQVPEQSIIPFLMAVVTGAVFIGFIFTAWAMPVGIATSAVGMFFWFWSNSNAHRPPNSPSRDNKKAKGSPGYEDREDGDEG